MENKLIVSLTSFPEAIPYAIVTVKSLLKSSVLPDKIVLYLTYSQFENHQLPDELIALAKANPIFEIIDYPVDIRSYRKLIPALHDFPEDTIITVDDDIIYHRDMIKQLLELHKRFPKDVIAHRAKKIHQGGSYRKWKKYRWYHFLLKRIYRNPLIVQTGVGGVLYPPHSLKKEMIDTDLFLKLAPTTDDIWFWAAAISNNRNIIPVPFGKNKPKGLDKPMEISLRSYNFRKGEDRNILAFNKILEEYPEIKDKINGSD